MFRVIAQVSILASFLLTASPSWAAWINDKAPDFTLQDLNGQPVSLPGLKGKVIFIDFWADWCPPCKKEFPELNKLAERYKESDMLILAVNLDKKRAHVDEFLERLPMPLSQRMTVLLDPQSTVVSSYGARAMPTSFIVDKEGVIRYIHLGFNEADPAKWVTEIEALLRKEN
ncbi:MAG: TlpA family protein disulfide reductase [Nitrospirae bacterium]|nr:TlpA family protein disulfide reductase [Nitrospirota bacterium]